MVYALKNLNEENTGFEYKYYPAREQGGLDYKYLLNN